MQSKKFESRIWIFVGFFMLSSSFDRARASVLCANVLGTDRQVIQKDFWKNFFSRVGRTVQPETKVATGLIPRETLVGKSAIKDCSLFKMHEFLGRGSVSVNLTKKLESIKDQFEYLGSNFLSYSHWLGTQNSFHTFRSKITGNIFSVQLPDQWELSEDKWVENQNLLEYLRSQEILAQSSHASRELEYYFEHLKAQMAYEWPSKKDVVNEYDKFRYWSGEPELAGRVEKYIIDKNPRGANSKWGMDDQYKKFVTRQLIEKEVFLLKSSIRTQRIPGIPEVSTIQTNKCKKGRRNIVSG